MKPVMLVIFAPIFLLVKRACVLFERTGLPGLTAAIFWTPPGTLKLHRAERELVL